MCSSQRRVMESAIQTLVKVFLKSSKEKETLGKKEFQGLVKSQLSNILSDTDSKEAVNNMRQRLDADQDGKVGFEEYMKLVGYLAVSLSEQRVLAKEEPAQNAASGQVAQSAPDEEEATPEAKEEAKPEASEEAKADAAAGVKLEANAGGKVDVKAEVKEEGVTLPGVTTEELPAAAVAAPEAAAAAVTAAAEAPAAEVAAAAVEVVVEGEEKVEEAAEKVEEAAEKVAAAAEEEVEKKTEEATS
uniref:S100 calcium binding protein U n=2 Tax=Scophthalmus maximus TaxID=52904 RepID=A0A8D3DVL1_SCOMX